MDSIKLEHEEKYEYLNRLANSPYTISEAANVLRMSEKSVRRQIDRRNLRKCKVFGRVLIPRKDVDNFIEKFSAFAA
jgi:excisionase family DNA binding protein